MRCTFWISGCISIIPKFSSWGLSSLARRTPDWRQSYSTKTVTHKAMLPKILKFSPCFPQLLTQMPGVWLKGKSSENSSFREAVTQTGWEKGCHKSHPPNIKSPSSTLPEKVMRYIGHFMWKLFFCFAYGDDSELLTWSCTGTDLQENSLKHRGVEGSLWSNCAGEWMSSAKQLTNKWEELCSRNGSPQLWRAVL